MATRFTRTEWRRRAAAAASAAALAAAVAAPAVAQERRPTGSVLPPPALTEDFARYEAVPDEQLGKMRGGFLLPAGVLNFAIDVAAQVNGHLIYDGQLTYSPGAGIGGGVTHYPTNNLGVPVSSNVKLGDAVNQIVTSIQAGNGNVAPTGFNGTNGFVATVQNTLSNVAIQQQMRVRLDLSADHFIQSHAVRDLRSRMGQLQHLSAFR